MPNILVADKIAEPGLDRLRNEPDVRFDVRHGLSLAELAAAVGEYDGMLIRSAVKVTAEVLANPGKLAAIARAGVGVDNVDLDAATAAGVLVLNTPDANTVSTAEHAVAMMLALHRRIPDAHRHVIDGQWNRGAYVGEQVAGKTLGIVGFGRIGRAVAQRAVALEMKVLVYDPFITEITDQADVVLAPDLEALLRSADCITLHASMSDATRGMIDVEQLAMMKPGAKLINCARGALVDEVALADALNNDRLGGAAIDVYAKEPPVDSPLLSARNVVLTPHLAASTAQAQAQVSIDAVDSLLAYLLRGEVRSAVNVSGLPMSLPPRGQGFVDLCARLGAVLSPWCQSGADCVTLTTYGDTLRDFAETLAWQALVAVVGPHLHERLNLVNARDQAKRRGIVVQHLAHSLRPGTAESIVLCVRSHGQSHEIEGTVYADGRPRFLAIDGYRMEMIPERSIVLIFNDDQPGVIGLVGAHFGNAGINIADMALSRRDQTALMVLKLDAAPAEELLEGLRAQNPPILAVHSVTLPPVPDEPAGT